ncbi:MAG: ATP-binding protein [Rhodocyclaceae bacterium]|nr:ATP-binding protein [Rhodocyclaceae bacterium]MCA3059910.1 ATP-binding protein [Rhodocyclaceae bacterium]MCA3084643.1 ATP-binding protein [Rhodocyclaceae bacterium]
MSDAARSKLTLGFHGKIIDHLGIQMYQSPTAALAEIVSNAWDADGEIVGIDFDFNAEYKNKWTISVADNGLGMTLDECQHRYLSVGYNRRATAPDERTPEKKRPVMGRKGIGKFAGFGIARFIRVKTVSKATGELTEFELDLQAIRQGDSYVEKSALEIEVLQHIPSGCEDQHGTTITLRDLRISKRIPENQFAESLARRFTINASADSFAVAVNGTPLPILNTGGDIEMSFPKDLPQSEIDVRKLSIDADGWGSETLPSGRPVRWRILFFRELVKNEEMAGVAVFAHKKLAQRPFMFNITGGTASQAGPEYMSGQVDVDWVDELGEDVISTERQRLNWEHEELQEFQSWGQGLLRRLMTIWKNKRTEKKLAALNERVSAFAERLQKLGTEGKTVRTALEKLAQVEKLTEEQFIELGSSVLLAWETGRLRELIHQIAGVGEMDEASLLSILAEANAITALHTAETVKAKLSAIRGLEERIKNKELENAVRDYIAKNPWLISPRWETFARETRVVNICNEAAARALTGDDFKGRVDLVLSSGRQLLLLEFMRPGLALDRDHWNRFNEYMDIIQENVSANTALEFDIVTGYIVADELAKKTGMKTAIENFRDRDRFAVDWHVLLKEAEHQWKEFLEHVKERAPDDARVQAL